jgi:hypothetical protein
MTAQNITPAHLRCAIGASCPSLNQLEDGRLLVVGKSVEYICRRAAIEDADRMIDYGPDNSHADDNAIRNVFRPIVETMGGDETAIVISEALLDVYVAEKVKSQWQTIDTAPKNVPVLVYDAHLQRAVVAQRMTAVEDGSVDWVYARQIDAVCPVAFICKQPTHWLPLPSPPASEGER